MFYFRNQIFEITGDKPQTLQPMFELSKQILQKVSFDKILFRKELTKAYKWLKPEERMLLYAWCLTTFGHEYKEVVLDVFKSVTKTG